MSENDQDVVLSFVNFLGWGVAPSTSDEHRGFPVPAAVIAYMVGATRYCPPKDTA